MRIRDCKHCGAPSGFRRYCSVECNFLHFVRIDLSGCWLWQGATKSTNADNAYGKFSLRDGRTKTTRAAHRVSYELFVGPIPDGAEVLHRCNRPPCVSPQHLMLGTHADNMAQAIREGRRGKLSPADAKRIRSDKRQAETIAAEYGISHDHVHKIRAGSKWKCLT